MNRQYWVNPPDSPVGYPVAEATCSVNFYPGAGNPEPDLPLMRNFLKEVEQQAAKNGIILHDMDEAWLASYWAPEIDRRSYPEGRRRLSPVEYAFQPDRSLPEPVTVALHDALIHEDFGFQLTTDRSSPHVSLLTIRAGHHIWQTAEECLQWVLDQRADSRYPHALFDSITVVVQLPDRNPAMIELPCLPLNDRCAYLAAQSADIEQIHSILNHANRSLTKYNHDYDENPFDDLTNDVYREMFEAAWASRAPEHAQTAYEAHKFSAMLADERFPPVQQPISLTAPGSPFTITVGPAA